MCCGFGTGLRQPRPVCRQLVVETVEIDTFAPLHEPVDVKSGEIKRTVATLTLLGVNNNLYTQIGLILLIALSAKNAILIVEVARELRRKGECILESAAQAAVARLRPILMTAIAFSLGVVPLLIAGGAGAKAQRSTGITRLARTISSTCLAVVLVAAFLFSVQCLAERRLKPAMSASLPSNPDVASIRLGLLAERGQQIGVAGEGQAH